MPDEIDKLLDDAAGIDPDKQEYIRKVDGLMRSSRGCLMVYVGDDGHLGYIEYPFDLTVAERLALWTYIEHQAVGMEDHICDPGEEYYDDIEDDDDTPPLAEEE